MPFPSLICNPIVFFKNFIFQGRWDSYSVILNINHYKTVFRFCRNFYIRLPVIRTVFNSIIQQVVYDVPQLAPDKYYFRNPDIVRDSCFRFTDLRCQGKPNIFYNIL